MYMFRQRKPRQTPPRLHLLALNPFQSQTQSNPGVELIKGNSPHLTRPGQSRTKQGGWLKQPGVQRKEEDGRGRGGLVLQRPRLAGIPFLPVRYG